MKKICGAFLAILMLGCFIGCNNNPSGDFSSKDDSLLGEITYTKPILPESVGKDPFEGLTELVNDSDEKFLVNEVTSFAQPGIYFEGNIVSLEHS